MAEKRRLNLSLNLSIPQQREAWHILRAIPPGRRTDAVCRMVLEHKRQTELLDTVRATIREELQKVKIVSSTETEEQPRAGDVDDNVLGFLLSLQGDEEEGSAGGLGW